MNGSGRILLLGGLGALLMLLVGAGLFALRGVGEQPQGIQEAGQPPAQNAEGSTGYVLLPESKTRGFRELLFLQLVREGADLPGGGQATRGYLTSTTAYYEPGLPVAQGRIDRIEGTVYDTSIEFTVEQYAGGASASPSSTYYYGTIEGSRMEVTGDLPGQRVTWVGEIGTLEDYHDEVERLVRETEDAESPMPD